jgi:hypothetical protein
MNLTKSQLREIIREVVEQETQPNVNVRQGAKELANELMKKNIHL